MIGGHPPSPIKKQLGCQITLPFLSSALEAKPLVLEIYSEEDDVISPDLNRLEFLILSLLLSFLSV